MRDALDGKAESGEATAAMSADLNNSCILFSYIDCFADEYFDFCALL